MTEAAADDLRGQLEAAYKASTDEPEVPEAETPEVETPEVETKAERERDEKGRFVAKAGEEAPEPVEPEIAPEISDPNVTEPETPEVQALAPPNGWSAEAKAKWHELPEDIQAQVLKREEDIHKQASKSDDERNFGREMYRTVQPYLAQIQAEGGTPVEAVKSLLNTAYILRVGTPEQKRNVLLQAAQQYGVNLASGQQPPTGQPVDPNYQALMQRINQLEGTLTTREQAEQQRLQAEIQSELKAFAADPAHVHFNEVKAHMAALLKEGTAKDLQDAYDQAVWARPDTRATLLAKQRAEEEQKRKAEAKRKADEAKRKNVSITGGPGETQSAPGNRSLRDELRANWDAAAGGV